MATKATLTLQELSIRALAPSVTYWYRLEPRPRTNSLTGPTSAPVRDPLWFITRQWQMGEFIAEDAASPAYVEIASTYGSLTDWKTATGAPQPIPSGSPLEPLVEREATTPDLALRVELGQTFELLWVDQSRNAMHFARPSPLHCQPIRSGHRSVLLHLRRSRD